MGTPQHPIGSGFGHDTTASEVALATDLSGRLALVTGGSSGLGLATTEALASAGAHVVIAARRPQQAEVAVAHLRGASVEVRHVDLSDLDSVRRFAESFLEAHPRLDIAINNAGIMTCPETRVGPGWEAQFAINHLGHFALINRLWPAIARSGSDTGARVVAVSSGAHAITDIRWDDPHFRATDYDKWHAYGQSKTANALFAVHLDAIGQSRGVRAFTVHPGSILTPLQRHLSLEEMTRLGWVDEDGHGIDPSFKTPAQGAATQVWASTSQQLHGRGGVYCEDCEIAPIAATSSPYGVHAHAVEPESAERLWHLSAALTGLATIP
jgi:NAD(P)-dependent dehydrogenase (short-subunit alcohol dehydrogenase family)